MFIEEFRAITNPLCVYIFPNRKTRRGYPKVRKLVDGAEEHAGGVDKGKDQVCAETPAKVAAAASEGTRTEIGI